MTSSLSSQHDAPTVLVVEDDPLVRFVAVEVLQIAGFTVVEAEDAHEAIAYMARGNRPDMLLTDVRMPGSIDGIELAVIVARRWPQVGILVCSAHARPAEDSLPAGAVFLAKPHTPGDLLERVRSLIAAPVATQEA